MEVKYLDLPAQFKSNEEIKRAILSILADGRFVLGPAVEEFEQNFARLCGVRHAVGLSSGTAGLFLALKVLGVGKGDEVISVPNSFVATIGAIAVTGAFPRMVDVGEDYNIDPQQIKKAINEKTKAVIPVHLTGNPARMDEVSAIAQERNLFVVEDAAQAVGASIDGQKTGSFGDMGVFSLHPLKNLNTCGDGGVITTNSGEYYNKLLLYRNHGLKNRNESQFFAYNCRLDSIKAAVANLQIKDIDRITGKRNRNALIYDKNLSEIKEYIEIPERREGVKQVFHTYVIKAERRDHLIDFLKNKGIGTKIYYPIPVHLMEAARKYGYKEGDFPVAEAQAKRIVSLPVHQHLTEKQIRYVIRCIYEFYGKKEHNYRQK